MSTWCSIALLSSHGHGQLPCLCPRSCHIPSSLAFLGTPIKRALPAGIPSSPFHHHGCLRRHRRLDERKWHLPRSSHKCRALSSQAQQPKLNYEFRDDKGEVELRIKLPEGRNGITASNVFVDAQDTSLSVALALPSSLLTIIPGAQLYGRIKSSETVWFVDEEEIVISLKKFDKDFAWPSLVEDWESLTEGVSNLLKGVPVYIVGESSEINWAVTRQLAEGLQYTPLKTSELLEQAAKKPLENMLAEEGVDAVADAEATIMSTLNMHVRLVVATLGGQYGVAAKQSKWNTLRAGITIWLSLSKATDEASAEEEAVRAKQEGIRAYANAEVVVALSGWEEGAELPVAEGCLKALKRLLESEKDLPVKKNLYVRLGCRGDWPNIMPPGSDPSAGLGP